MAPKAQPGWQIYEEQMECLRYGHALWEPAPTSEYTRISIGDVGFVREGRFHLLFSAGIPLGERERGIDVPSTFEELTLGKPQTTQPRDPCCVAASTSREVGASCDVTVPIIQTLEAGENFSFELTGDRGAALTTRYPTYNEDSQLDAEFRDYTKRHYKSWVKFASDKKYGKNLSAVLVSGFDTVKNFAIMAYSNNGTSVRPGATFSTPMFGPASASTSWIWRTPCGPHAKRGPQQLRPPDLPPLQSEAAQGPCTEFNQCVFLRYYTMREGLFGFPKVIRAGAGPHDLGSGENRGVTFPELTVQSDAEPVRFYESLGGRWDPATDDTSSGPDTVTRNVPYDEGYDSWDVIADYVLRNSDAKSVLMHHKDLAGIRAMGDLSDISSLLAIHKPRIVVDQDGVGGIVCGEDALSSRDATMGSLPIESRDENVHNRLIGHDSSPNEAIPPSEATFSQDDVEMNDDFHGDEGVRRTNSPPNSQAALLKRDQLNDGDPGPIFTALGDHFNSLFLPQDKVPPSPINGVCVPQRKYDKGTGRGDPSNQGRVLFIREDGTYLPVKEALEERYGGLMNQDLLALDKALTVMVRFEWPGYQPKEYQLRVVDWRGEPQKVPLRKLSTDVAKIINKFVGDMQGKPIQPNYAMWRVGQDAIRVENLRLAALEQVSAGSWQTRLFYTR